MSCGFKQSQCPDCVNIDAVDRILERHGNVGLGAEVVHLVWLNLVEQTAERVSVRQIAIVKKEPGIRDMRIPIQMVYTTGRKARGPPNETMNLVALCEEQLGKVRPVLPRDPCDECLRCQRSSLADENANTFEI